jgi:ABC-2 type transport system permease protein
MSDALRFEWVRLRTLRSTYWLIASALTLNAAIAFLVALATRNDTLDEQIVGMVLAGGGAHSPLPLATVFLAVLGIFATGHEYRYGTIQPTLTTVPQRTRLLAAKIVVVGGTALVVAAVSMLVNVAAGLVFWGEFPDLTDQPLDEVLPGALLLALLWTVLGVALGQLFRGVPAPLVVILVVPLIVEQLVFRLSYAPPLGWLEPVVKFLPFTAGQRLVSLGTEAAGTDASDVDLFGRWAAGGVFAAFVAAILVTAWILFQRRDA